MTATMRSACLLSHKFIAQELRSQPQLAETPRKVHQLALPALSFDCNCGENSGVPVGV